MPSSNPPRRQPSSPVVRTQSPAVGTLTPQAVNAPVFVPKFAAAAQAAATTSGASGTASTEVKVPSPPPQSTEPAPSEMSVNIPQPSNVWLNNCCYRPTFVPEQQGYPIDQNGYEEQVEPYPEGEYAGSQEYTYQPEYDDYEYQVDQAGNAMQTMGLVRGFRLSNPLDPGWSERYFLEHRCKLLSGTRNGLQSWLRGKYVGGFSILSSSSTCIHAATCKSMDTPFPS